MSLFFEESTSSFSPKRDEKENSAKERWGKKREIVSALSANDVGKKEDGRERMDGNVGGGKRVIRKNHFNTKLLSSSLWCAHFENEAFVPLSSLSPNSTDTP